MQAEEVEVFISGGKIFIYLDGARVYTFDDATTQAEQAYKKAQEEHEKEREDSTGEIAPEDVEKPFEIGTYTTKKGKIKTSIRFFQPPTPAQIEALKTAFYWEYNGTWNGSPRKLPEIFKH